MPDLREHNLHAPLPKIVVIVGPTAVGKTALAIDIAEAFGAEIVNVDSRLFYRGMDIGTAKPNASQLARVPHHLIDFLEPNDPISLATVQDLAFSAIDEILARETLPLLVGGTPQYVNAIVENWRIPRVEPNPELRARLEQEELNEPGVLLARLGEVDPEGADKHAGNTRRIIRALEVYEATGQPITALQGKDRPRYDALELALWRPRDELHARIDARAVEQIEAGLIDEVRVLLDAGADPSAGSFGSIGYRQVLPYIRGESTLDEVIERIRVDCHRLVRHQDTWWRKNPRLVRIDLTNPDARKEIEGRMANFLDNR
jgi:tRNA dimethylallyltransferase